MFGKSSFINRLAKKNIAKTENKPGITVKKQWIRVTNNIEILDTPGILWPKFEDEETGPNLAFTGAIKDEILDKEEIAYSLLKYLIENNIENLTKKYGLDKKEIQIQYEQAENKNEAIMQILEQIGRNRGALVSGGKVDRIKISNILLRDFREAKIGKITLEKVN